MIYLFIYNDDVVVKFYEYITRTGRTQKTRRAALEIMKSKQTDRHRKVAECRKMKSQKAFHGSIPHDLFVTKILPMLPQKDYESAVMKVVKSKNAEDLHFLLGYTSTSVPSFLKYNEKYAKAARFTIILPKLQRLGFKLSKDIFDVAVKINDL